MIGEAVEVVYFFQADLEKEAEGSRRKQEEAEGSRRKQKETEGSRRKQKEAEGHRRKQKEAAAGWVESRGEGVLGALLNLYSRVRKRLANLVYFGCIGVDF